MESEDINLKIFQSVSTLIVQPDYNDGQNAFFEKNCSKFKGDEENSHEYKGIYDEYLYITEKVIEAQLKEQFGFTDEQIKAFYDTFKDNLKRYEEENMDTVDMLYSFVDFDKFKSQMLQIKKSLDARDAGTEDDADKTKMDGVMPDTETAYADFLKLEQEDLNSNGWKCKINMKEFKDYMMLKFHQRKDKESGMDILRVSGKFQKLTPEKLLDFFLNPPPGKMKMVIEQKTLEKNADGSMIQYWLMKMPLMSNRDLCSKILFKHFDDGSVYMQLKSCEHPEAPNRKGVVRMFMYTSAFVGWDKEQPDLVTYTEYDQMNMKGSVPSALMNMAMASETQKELKNMCKWLVEGK